jgi:hypothetical protein
MRRLTLTRTLVPSSSSSPISPPLPPPTPTRRDVLEGVVVDDDAKEAILVLPQNGAKPARHVPPRLRKLPSFARAVPSPIDLQTLRSGGAKVHGDRGSDRVDRGSCRDVTWKLILTNNIFLIVIIAILLAILDGLAHSLTAPPPLPWLVVIRKLSPSRTSTVCQPQPRKS